MTTDRDTLTDAMANMIRQRPENVSCSDLLDAVRVFAIRQESDG